MHSTRVDHAEEPGLADLAQPLHGRRVDEQPDVRRQVDVAVDGVVQDSPSALETKIFPKNRCMGPHPTIPPPPQSFILL